MSRKCTWVLAGLFSLLSLSPTLARAQGPALDLTSPQVELVFCVDTTGSMRAYLGSAQQKILSITKQIAAGNPMTKIKVGIVAYRDRGEEYVTKIFELNDDLDVVQASLKSLVAKDGGDAPEDVNKALYDAVAEVRWSGDKNVEKIVYLIGDAPPHMDYKDQIQYPDICKLAQSRNITINTIQCGNDDETRKYWLDICRLGQGVYYQIEAGEAEPVPAPAPCLLRPRALRHPHCRCPSRRLFRRRLVIP